MEDFKEILELCEKKFDKRKERHGDSWKTCKPEILIAKLREEVNEYFESFTVEEEIDELTDIINVCLMLAHRRMEQPELHGKRK